MELAALATAAIDGLRLLSVKPGRGAGVKGTSCWATDDAGNEWQIYAPNKRLNPAQLNAMLRGQHQLALARQDRTLPFSVPRVEGIVNRKDGSLVFVFPALGGEEAGEAAFVEGTLFANSLGRALAALHTVNPSRIVGCRLPEQSPEDHRNELLQLVRRHAAAIPADLRNRWMDTLRVESLWQYAPCTVHGSLAAEDVQVTHEGAVVGMKGFETMGVGDPASDIAGILFFADEAFLQTFEAAYSRGRSNNDLHVVTRARLLAELETLRWYDAAVVARDRSWRDEGIAALRELDADVRGTWIVEPQPEVVEIHFTAEEEPLLRLRKPGHDGSNQLAAPGAETIEVEGAETSATVAHVAPSQSHGHTTGNFEPTWDETPYAEEWGHGSPPATDGSIEVPFWSGEESR